MARDLLDRLVGPVTAGRMGALVGYIAAVLGTYVRSFWIVGDGGNLTGMVAVFFVGPIGLIVGFMVGRALRWRSRAKSAPAQDHSAAADERTTGPR